MSVIFISSVLVQKAGITIRKVIRIAMLREAIFLPFGVHSEPLRDVSIRVCRVFPLHRGDMLDCLCAGFVIRCPLVRVLTWEISASAEHCPYVLLHRLRQHAPMLRAHEAYLCSRSRAVIGVAMMCGHFPLR